MKHFYYDAEAGELRPGIEGTDLKPVQTIRIKALGLAVSFDEDGYVDGLWSDNGEWVPIPFREDQRRPHLREYGSRIRLEAKPEQLDALPAPGEIAALDVGFYRGAGKWLKEGRIALHETMAGNLILVVDRKVQFDFDGSFVHDLRRLISDRLDFIADLDGEKWGIKGQGPVYVRREDVAAMIFAFSRFLE